MKELKPVGVSIEESLAAKPPTREELEKARQRLLAVGGDPANARILVGADRIPLMGDRKKKMGRVG